MTTRWKQWNEPDDKLYLRYITDFTAACFDAHGMSAPEDAIYVGHPVLRLKSEIAAYLVHLHAAEEMHTEMFSLLSRTLVQGTADEALNDDIKAFFVATGNSFGAKDQ